MTQEDQLRRLEQLARYNPGHKLSPYAQQLVLEQESLDEDPGFSILSTLGQVGAGFVQGMSTLRFGDDPEGWWEELARGVGSMAGFIGVVPGVGTIGSAVTRTASRGLRAMGVLPKISDDVMNVGKAIGGAAEGFRSIPLLVGDTVAKYARSGMHELASKEMMARFLTRKNIDLLEGGVRMGSAFASMSWQDGADQMMKSFLLGGFFGTGDRFLANLPALKDHKVARAITASVFNGLPSTAMGQPLELQVFDYLLGAYFGLETPYRQRAAMEIVQDSTKDMSRFEFYSRFKQGDGEKKVRETFGEDAPEIITEIDNMMANEFGRMTMDEEGKPYSSVANIVAKTILAPAIKDRSQVYESKGYTQDEAMEMATADIFGSDQAAKVLDVAVKTDEQYMDQALGEIDISEKFKEFSRGLSSVYNELEKIRTQAKDIGGTVKDRDEYIAKFEEDVNQILNPTRLSIMPDKINQHEYTSEFREPEEELAFSMMEKLFPKLEHEERLKNWNEIVTVADKSIMEGNSFFEFRKLVEENHQKYVGEETWADLSRIWHYRKDQRPVAQMSISAAGLDEMPDFTDVGKDMRLSKAPSFFERKAEMMIKDALGEDFAEPVIVSVRTDKAGVEAMEVLGESAKYRNGLKPGEEITPELIATEIQNLQVDAFDKGYVMAPMTKAGGAFNLMRKELAGDFKYIEQMKGLDEKSRRAGKSGRDLLEDYEAQRQEYIESGVRNGFGDKEKLGLIFDTTFEANMRMQLEAVQGGMPLKQWIELTKGGVVGNAMAATKRMQLAMTEGLTYSPRDFEDIMPDGRGMRSIILSAANKDGSHKALVEERQKDGSIIRRAVGEDAFEIELADGTIKKRQSEAVRDGLDVVRQGIFGRMNTILGQNPQNTGQLKNVAIFADERGGFMSKRSMKVADSYQEQVMAQHGLDMVYYDTSAKNVGTRPVVDYVDVLKLDGSIEREFYDRATGLRIENLESHAFYTPIDAVTMNFSTKETTSSSLKPQTLAMQLMRTPDMRTFSKGVMENLFEENFLSVVRGDDVVNAEFENLRGLEKELALSPDVEKVARTGKVEKTKAYKLAADMRRLESYVARLDIDKLGVSQVRSILSENVGSNYTLLYDKVFRHVAKATENFDPSEIGDYEPSSTKEMTAGERILSEVKIVTPAMVMSNKTLRKFLDTRMDAYMKNRIQKPKVDYSMKAVGTHIEGHHELRYGRIERGEFMMGAGARNMRVKSQALAGQDSTLGKLWDMKQELIGKKKKDLTADEKKFLSKVDKDLEMIVVRVPMDSVSGARVLKFKGFREEAGHGIALNHMDMSYLGGMDLDFDTAFIYQNIGKTVVAGKNGAPTSFVDELKFSQSQWEKIVPDGTPEGKRVYMEQKGEYSKDFFEIKDMPEQWRGEATTFSPIPLGVVGYNTWTGKRAVGYAANAAQHNRSFAMHAWNTLKKNAKDGKVEFSSIKDKESGEWIKNYLMYPNAQNTFEFTLMGREGINWAADSSDYFSSINQTKIKSKLADLLFENGYAGKISRHPMYKMHSLQMTVVANRQGATRLGSFDDMAKVASLLPEIATNTVKDRTFNLVRQIGQELSEGVDTALGFDMYEKVFRTVHKQLDKGIGGNKNLAFAMTGYSRTAFGNKNVKAVRDMVQEYKDLAQEIKKWGENPKAYEKAYADKHKGKWFDIDRNIKNLIRLKERIKDFVANDIDDVATATLLLSKAKKMAAPFKNDPKALQTLTESLLLVSSKADSLREDLAAAKYASKRPGQVEGVRTVEDIRADILNFKKQLPGTMRDFFEIRLLGSQKRHATTPETKELKKWQQDQLENMSPGIERRNMEKEFNDQIMGSGILTDFYAMPEISGKSIREYLNAVDQIVTGAYKRSNDIYSTIDANVLRYAVLPSDPQYTRLAMDKQSGAVNFDADPYYGHLYALDQSIQQVSDMIKKNQEMRIKASSGERSIDMYSKQEIAKAKKRAKELRDEDISLTKEAKKMALAAERDKAKFLESLPKELIPYAKANIDPMDALAVNYAKRLDDLVHRNPQIAKEFLSLWRGLQTSRRGFFKPLREASFADMEMFLRAFEKRDHFLSRFSKKDIRDGVSFHHWMVFPETLSKELMQHDMKFRKLESFGVGEDGSSIRAEVRIPTSTHGQLHNVVDTMIGAKDSDVNFMSSWLERNIDDVRQVNLSSKSADGDVLWEMAVRQRELGNVYGDTSLYKRYYDQAKIEYDKIASKTYTINGAEMSASEVLKKFVEKQDDIVKVLWKKYYEGQNSDAMVLKGGTHGDVYARYDIEATLKNIFAQVQSTDRKSVPMIGINNMNRLVFQRKVENMLVDYKGTQTRIGDVPGADGDKAYKKAIDKLVKAKYGPDIVEAWDMSSYWPHAGWPKAQIEKFNIKVAATKVAGADDILAEKLMKDFSDESIPKSKRDEFVKELNNLKHHSRKQLEATDGFREDGESIFVENVSIGEDVKDAGMYFRPTQSKARGDEFTIPGWIAGPAALNTYIESASRTYFNKAMALTGDNLITKFEKSGADLTTEGKVAWGQFMRLFLRDNLGYSSTLPKAYMDNPNLNVKKSPYYWFSDENVVAKYKSISEKLGSPTTLDDSAIAEKFKWLSNAEAKWQLTSLLSRPKTYLNNVVGGGVFNWIENGGVMMRNAQSISYLRQYVNPQWKTMDDAYAFAESHGALESWLKAELNVVGSSSRAAYSKGVQAMLDVIKKKPLIDDRTLMEELDRLGVTADVMDKAAVFMKKSERLLRYNAFMSSYLKAREIFEANGMRMDYNDPWLIEFAKRGVKATQFIYNNANRPAFSRTNIGRVFSRFQLWAWNSTRFMRDTYSQAADMGFKKGTPEMERYKRMVIANAFMMVLAGAFAYSIFDVTLPQPFSWIRSMGEWAFGSEEQSDKAFMGPLPGPLNIVAPPSVRALDAGLSFAADGATPNFFSSKVWTMLPFGALTRDIYRTVSDPKKAPEYMLGIPWTQMIQE